MNAYSVRDMTLKKMGFSSYREYLSSDLWRSIRTKILKRDGGICVRCGKAATEVHHRSYRREVLMGFKKKLKYLSSVCRDCHKRGEFDGGQKTTLSTANQRMGMRRMDQCERCGVKISTYRKSRLCSVCHIPAIL